MKQPEDDNAVRITQQFRAGQAMVYDLRNKVSRLTLRMSAQDENATGVTSWRVEASTSSSPDAIVVSECGPTRADALRAVGKSWGEKLFAQNLPIFDWESVARALTAVRAI